MTRAYSFDMSSYPDVRLRRFRRSGPLRALVRETRLDLDDFVMPLFVGPQTEPNEALPAMGGIGYRQFAAAIMGRMSADEALRLMVRDTCRYAKRQMTWFSREPEVRWIDVDQAGGIEGAAESILKVVMQEGLIE